MDIITNPNQTNLATTSTLVKSADVVNSSQDVIEQTSAIEDKLTLDGKEKAKDEESVYKNESKSANDSSEGGSSIIDKLIEELKKQLEKLYTMLKATKDIEAKTSILAQISGVQSRLVEALEQKAKLEEGGA